MSPSKKTKWGVFSLKLECESEKFGLGCKKRCSGHCNNSVPCDHVSGECHGGCQNGYLGARCFNCKIMILSIVKWRFKYNIAFFKKHICWFQHAKPDIMEKTVLFNALQVAMERVNIFKGHAKYVKKDGTLNVL